MARRRPADNALRLMLQQILAEHYNGVILRMAKGIGMSPTRLGRVIGGKPDADAIKPEKLLRLAEISGRPPGDLLRAAGRDELVDLIERMFGRATLRPAPKLTAAQRELLEAFRQLPQSQRDALLDVIQRAARSRTE